MRSEVFVPFFLRRPRPLIRLFGGASLHYADLTKADLSGTDLSNAVLVLGFLSSADLTGANLTNGQKYADSLKSGGEENSGP